VDKKRASLSDDNVNKLVCLNNCLKRKYNSWITCILLHLVADSRATFIAFMEYTTISVAVAYFYHFLVHVVIVRLIATKVLNRAINRD